MGALELSLITLLTDHVEARTPVELAVWLSVVALWLAGVALVIVLKFRSAR